MESSSGNLRRLGEILLARERLTQEILADALASQLIDRLRQSWLLADLSREELAQIGEQTEQVMLDPGEALFQEGYRGNSVYVILDGRLILSRSTREAQCAAGVVIRGDVLGERGYFTDGTRECSAYATEHSVLLKIPYALIPYRANIPEKAAPPDSPAQIVHRACAVLRADRAYLFYRDQETGDLIVQAGEGEGACGFSVMAGTDIAGWVALKREIVNLREAYLDPRFDPALDIQTGYWTRTLLAVLEVVNRHTGWFDADDEALLHAFAQQCAAALCLPHLMTEASGPSEPRR
jgi:hypothetical protein